MCLELIFFKAYKIKEPVKEVLAWLNMFNAITVRVVTFLVSH